MSIQDDIRFVMNTCTPSGVFAGDDILKMIQAAVLAEREACADLCYKDKENNIVMTHGTGKRMDMLCAAAIRARRTK